MNGQIGFGRLVSTKKMVVFKVHVNKKLEAPHCGEK